jgi:hypothetical protein
MQFFRQNFFFTRIIFQRLDRKIKTPTKLFWVTVGLAVYGPSQDPAEVVLSWLIKHLAAAV